MPCSYSKELCDLIRSMLSHDAEQRPSVNQLLQLPFVKHNIRLFLERATIRKNEKLIITCVTMVIMIIIGVNKQYVKKRVSKFLILRKMMYLKMLVKCITLFKR